MIRISSRVNVSSGRKVISLWKEQRLKQSTHRGNSGVNKGILALAGVSTGFAGIVGYAAWDPENRKTVESLLPGSSFVFEPILGRLVEEVPKIEPVTSSKPDHGPKKKPERVKETPPSKTSSPSAASTIALPPAPPLAPPTATVQETKKDAGAMESSKAEELESRLASIEATQAAKNEDLERRLEEAVTTAQKMVTSALTAAEDAATAVRRHAEKAYAAIDSGEADEKLFAVASEVAKAKKQQMQDAEGKLNDAKDKIKHLQVQISEGKDSKLTMENSMLGPAEETLSELNYAMSKISSTMAEALRDSTAISEFRDLVEASRTQFEAEVRSLLPDVKMGEKSDKQTPDELNLLLAHAHRKVMALQKALAKQQTVDKGRYKDALLRQREVEIRMLDGKVQAELERQRRDLGLEHRHRLQQLRDDLELELRTQLKRQAAAHSDHLAEMLSFHEHQLDAKWEKKMNEALQDEKDNFHKCLSRIQGELYGLKSALKSRADADNAAHAAHELWLACESLKTALRMGQEDSHSWEDQLLPLKNQVDSIRKVAGDNDPFVKAVLSSLPEEAMKRGVYTEDALRERFLKVDRVCRRVALIRDNGGSLLRYLLSYLQSFFLIGAFDKMPRNELRDEPFDVDNLDTHDILARVRYFIAKDDLLQAVRYLNLLRGEPRIVASDWLREAKIALEARQAADALMAYAAATGAKAL